jgi:hypothetical protein
MNAYVKDCKYGCGKTIFYDEKEQKWLETDTEKHHSYPRCKSTLTKQGKEVPFSLYADNR